MKRLISGLIIVFFALSLIACNNNENELSIAVSFEPAAQILNLIRPNLAAEGINLNIRHFTHFGVANVALQQNEVMVNFVQHQHFMNLFNVNTGADLLFVGGVYHAKLSLYSQVFSAIDAITPNSNILMINDDVNFARSLVLLHQANLLELDEISPLVNMTNIINNPLNLTFERVDATTMAILYQERQTDLAIMYPTFTRSVDNINFLQDQVIFTQPIDEFIKTFAIGIATNQQNVNHHKVQRLIYHLNSATVSNWIVENYGWAAIPYTKITNFA